MQKSRAATRSKSSDYGRALLLIAQAPRWRSLFLTFLLLIIACCTWSATSQKTPRALLRPWTPATSNIKDQGVVKPDHLKLSNLTLDLESGEHSTVPSQLRKENPQFHLLIHAPKINAGVCRCLLSSYILDYPPPTLIGYEPPTDPWLEQSWNENDRGPSREQNGIPDVSHYLKNEPRIKEKDALLIVDGDSTIFQLPSDVLLSTFATETRHRNNLLASEYPAVTLNSPSGPHDVQRFNQSAIFASTRKTTVIPGRESRLNFFGRVQQSLPETKVNNVLNDAAIMGTAASLRRLFYTANRANNQVSRSDGLTFRTMLSQQARVRSAVFISRRQRRSVWSIWKLWLTFHFSVDAAVRAEEEKEARAAALRDVGIGLDSESKMIYTIPDGSDPGTSDRRVGYIESTNATGLELPDVLKGDGLKGPYAMHPSHLHFNLTTASNAYADHETRAEGESEMPPGETSWDSIPLLLDPKTAQIPPLISGSSDDVWEKMWFHPHARTLLNQYLQRSQSKEVASEAAVGGERWWDSRGGRGGVWTSRGEWLDAGELCNGFGADLFADKEEFWEERTEILGPEVRVIMVGADGLPVEDQQSEQGAEEPQAQSSKGDASEGDLSRDDKAHADGASTESSDGRQEEAKVDGHQENSEDGSVNEVKAQDEDIPIAIMADGSRKALSDLGSAS